MFNEQLRILLACCHYPVASGRYMRDAFRREGCDVKTFGPAMGDMIWGMRVHPDEVWIPDAAPMPNVVLDCDVASCLARFGDWHPDLIVVMDSAFDVVGKREDFPCPKVLYGVDNHVRTYWHSDANWYDHKFLAHKHGPMLPVCDCNDMTWLPCAYDPVIFTPSPIPMAERRYDVALVGFPYPDRVSLVEAMKQAGIETFAMMGALYEDYRNIYHNARISLCKSAAGDVAQRIFETAAMGCAILSDECADFNNLGWQAGKDYLSYVTIDGAVEAAKLLLTQPALLWSIAKAGQTKAVPETWDARARTILQWLKDNH